MIRQHTMININNRTAKDFSDYFAYADIFTLCVLHGVAMQPKAQRFCLPRISQ